MANPQRPEIGTSVTAPRWIAGKGPCPVPALVVGYRTAAGGAKVIVEFEDGLRRRVCLEALS